MSKKSTGHCACGQVMDANIYRITDRKSNGWSLIFCKGPEG